MTCFCLQMRCFLSEITCFCSEMTCFCLATACLRRFHLVQADAEWLYKLTCIASTPKSSSPSGLAVGDHLLDQRSSSEAVGWASPVTVGGALMSSSASSVATVYIDGDRFAVFALSILQNCPGVKNKVTPAMVLDTHSSSRGGGGRGRGRGNGNQTFSQVQ